MSVVYTTDAEVYTCASGEIDFSKRCIYKIEDFTYENQDPVAYFQANKELWQNSVLILQDIFCGVVPPCGESGAQMKARVLAAFSEIQENTCIITYGGVIAAIMAHIFPEEERNLYEWQPCLGGGYRIYNGKFRCL